MGREYELKFRADPRIQQEILQAYPGSTQTLQMETTYYDTQEESFSRARCTLRLRKENGHPVCTLKAPEQGIARGEWEVVCGSVQEALPLLRQMGAPVGEPGPLFPVCAAAFVRIARTLAVPGGVLELACDQGVLRGGDRTQPLCEVEIEVKSGPDSLADALGETLRKTYGLVPEPLSKFARARALREEARHG